MDCNVRPASMARITTEALAKTFIDEQIAAIRRLESRGQLEQLPEKLRQTAALRVENPEATLTELAAMLEPPVTKSALNHRMRKLIELANS